MRIMVSHIVKVLGLGLLALAFILLVVLIASYTDVVITLYVVAALSLAGFVAYYFLQPRLAAGWLTFGKVARMLKVIGWILIIFPVVIFYLALADEMSEPEFFEDIDEVSLSEETATEEGCNVQGVLLRGTLVNYALSGGIPEGEEEGATTDITDADSIVYAIEAAEKEAKTKAVMIEVDSLGGDPVAAQIVAEAIAHAKKPVVAHIRGYADSAAYWAISPAGTIFAYPGSDIGSIGVTMSYLDNTEKNKRDGLTYQDFSSGVFKESGNPDRALSPAERDYLMRDVKLLHEQFVQAVAANRELPLERVTALADGSTMLAPMALENGLIDKIGGKYDVEAYLKELTGKTAVVCWD